MGMGTNTAKASKVRLIYKLGGFLAFIMLSYLGIRGYKISVEKMKINGCIEEISELVRNVQHAYRSEYNYGTLDYNQAVKMRLIPQKMFKKDGRDALNSFNGGIDIYYSSLHEKNDDKAFSVSFQGLSANACRTLLTMPWDEGQNITMIVVGGFPIAQPSDILNRVYTMTKQKDVKSFNIFKSDYLSQITTEELNRACSCPKNTCSVVWKFR